MKIGDRVLWRFGKPEDAPEYNGKITGYDDELNYWIVRFDDGTEEKCDAEDLEVVNA